MASVSSDCLIPPADVSILFPTGGLNAPEGTFQVAVLVSGRLERAIHFSVETLDSLNVEGYANEGDCN